jgi:hypothetical protein
VLVQYRYTYCMYVYGADVYSGFATSDARRNNLFKEYSILIGRQRECITTN